MKTWIALVFGVTFPATMAVAADQGPGAEALKMICKKDRQAVDTGSNIRRPDKRICKTRMQWDELERDAKETFRRIDDTATRTPEYRPGRGN